MRFFIDFISRGDVSDFVELEGWLYSCNKKFNLVVELDGRFITKFQPDFVREDIFLTFSEFGRHINTGFKLQLPIARNKFSLRGASQIKLFYESRDKKELLASSVIFHADCYMQSTPDPKSVFYFTVASSNISLGGFGDFIEKLSPFSIGYCQLGFMAPVLYMRSTLGVQHDWQFDPDFDAATQQKNNKLVVADSLADILNYSKNLNVPCLIGLNGGIWSDAAGTCPEWDLTDHLEEDINNCQWNQRDEVMPDDYLKHLTGAEFAPELSRSLTLSHYNETVRAYKKRNLQQAGRIIAEFAREHPELYIGTNLDPDCYQNPFFEGEQWYDFNPASLQQFRDWLSASGVYANELRNTIKHTPFDLNSLNFHLDTTFSCWDEVTPPRDKICILEGAEDKFLNLWEEFRRHIVQRHYSDLANWLGHIGVHKSFIYSSQGFTTPQIGFEAFALRLNSPVKNFDSGGMSLEGSKPDCGHIGAILYGESARNNIRTENAQYFFENIRRLDPDWAVVEFNPADLRDPANALPDYGFSWDCLREMFNHGARFVNLMAWNGSTANDLEQDHFNAHMALRDTPLEQAVIDFMLMYADVARGGQCYTFGSMRYASLDGWSSQQGYLQATTTGLRVQLTQGAADLCAPQAYLYGQAQSIHIEFFGALVPELQVRLHVHGEELECTGQILRTVAGWMYKLDLPELPKQMQQLTLHISAKSTVSSLLIQRIVFNC